MGRASQAFQISLNITPCHGWERNGAIHDNRTACRRQGPAPGPAKMSGGRKCVYANIVEPVNGEWNVIRVTGHGCSKKICRPSKNVRNIRRQGITSPQKSSGAGRGISANKGVSRCLPHALFRLPAFQYNSTGIKKNRVPDSGDA